MTLSIAEQYQREYGEDAVYLFAKHLMDGDPASFKAGYTRENAIIATAEAFGISNGDVEEEMDIHD